MQLGVFIPIGNNGWLISTTSPQYMPTFDLNRTIVEKAERFGFDFALSMIKLHGFGGPSQFWDYNLESFTLMAGLASVTQRIQLFATCAVLTMPPPIAARMAVTIDSISHGRFGVNIISGWQRREYTQMGLWPGAEHYKRRYQYCAEYVTIMRELWETGHGSGGDRLSRRASQGRSLDQRLQPAEPARAAGRRQAANQPGRPCRLLRQRGAHAGRDVDGARRAGRDAHVRRLRHRHGAVRNPHHAADALPR